MIEQPQFRTVLRGFDPDQVIAAITELTGSLAIARRTAAERTMELTKAQERAAALERRPRRGRRAWRPLRGREAARPRVRRPRDPGQPRSSTWPTRRPASCATRASATPTRSGARPRREAARMNAAAAEAADAIVQQASQQRRGAARGGAALAREDRSRPSSRRRRRRGGPRRGGRRGPSHPGRVRRDRRAAGRDPRRYLGGVVGLLDTLDAELSREPDDLAPQPRRVSRARIVAGFGLKCEPRDDDHWERRP